MQTLIVSDIFGRTKALEDIASKIAGSARIIDPYDSRSMGFVNEKKAYQYFSEKVGMGNYTEALRRYISENCTVFHLIGFSAGASAIWNISNHEVAGNIVSATCFYGSQIRNNIHESVDLLGFWFEIKTCEKNNHRHIVDIPRIIFFA